MNSIVNDVVASVPSSSTSADSFKSAFLKNLAKIIPNALTQVFALIKELGNVQDLSQNQLSTIMTHITTKILADIEKAPVQ